MTRGSVYYLPKPVSATDLATMRRIDELHMEFPFAGSRMLRDLLLQEGIKVGRLHVATLMKKMAIEAIYRRSDVDSDQKPTASACSPHARARSQACRRTGERRRVCCPS